MIMLCQCRLINCEKCATRVRGVLVMEKAMRVGVEGIKNFAVNLKGLFKK